MARKPREGEQVCNCSTYKHPHRFGGGNCNGQQMVDDYWFSHFGSGECASCVQLDGVTCQVVEGIESPKYCPVVEDFVKG